jgi:hypothetical protein
MVLLIFVIPCLTNQPTRVPRIIITPADDNLFSSEDSTDTLPNAAPTPAQSYADVSQLMSEEPLDGMESPSSSEDGNSSSTPSSGPSTPPQHPKRIPYVKPENRHFVSNTAALWSTRHGRSYRAVGVSSSSFLYWLLTISRRNMTK